MQKDLPRDAVAIVGIGCRFPGGANTPETFWDLLCDGVDAITEVPPGRFDVDEVYDPDPETPGKMYTRKGGFIEGVDEFDADFFGISPREARRMDPQHRLLLEVVWEALEDGGLVPDQIAGTSTGVFVGISTHDYGDLQVRPERRELINAHVNIGTALCAAANRISHLFDLHGPSLAVETACSSSLTAVHLACQSLQRGESSIALAGGVNLMLTPEPTIAFCKASMVSPDGQCRAFDAGANGYVRSEGAGVVVLKPVERAVEDNDPIYAVIRGTAINEDGRTAGISLPNGEAQEELLRQTLRETGIAPTDIQYVEAHGTGTAAGDPIEANVLGRVFGADRTAEEPFLIGSAKTNVGHLEAGAGITGLIKAALSLKHRKIPPSLHFHEPNPEIPFDDLNLQVVTTLEPWPESDGPAMAGVNAFGFGGSNAHAILEEPPRTSAPERSDPEDAAHLLAVSARTPDALHAYGERYVQHLREETTTALHDICYTASRRRSHHEHRLAVVGHERAQLAEHLEAFLKGEDHEAVTVGHAQRSGEPRLAFAFSGMGPQWWGMGRQLLAEEPVYRERLEECDRVLQPISGWSLLKELSKSEANSRIARADFAHVANCAVQIALTALWRSWGIRPDAVVGHSSGEIAAACVAGALDLEDALYLAYHRGRLQHTCAGTGGMLAASLSPEEAASAVAGFEDRVSLAAFNSPSAVTLSGDVDALEEIAADLEVRDVFWRLLEVDIPYHAPQMDVIRDELLDVLEDLKPRAANLPLISSTTGTWLEGQEMDRYHWWQNVRTPVRFEEAVGKLVDDGCEIFLEVGPHPVLPVYLEECLAERDHTADVLPTLRRKEDERSVMLRSLGALHARGRDVHWPGIYPTGRCVSLPTYPWQRERYWFEPTPDEPTSRPTGVDTGHPLLGRRLSSPKPSWEAELDDSRLDYLNAHVVGDSIVFPGTGYVEMMLAAATELEEEDGPIALGTVEFHNLLFLEASREVVLQLHQDPGDGSINIHSAPKGENPSWTLHATAGLNGHSTGNPAVIDVDQVRERCTTEMPVEEHFQALERRGFHYGPAFRGVREIRVGEGEALARIGWPADVDRSVDSYHVHPALLDVALQVGAVASYIGQEEQPVGPLFPVSIQRATFHAPPTDRFWAHIAVHDSDQAFAEGDILLVDDAGNVNVSLEGVRMKLLDEGRSEGRSETVDWLYESRWEEKPLDRPSGDPKLRSSRAVRDAVERSTEKPEEVPEVGKYYHTVEPVLDRVAARYAHAALNELGWRADRHAGLSAEALADALDVVPSHRRLVAALAEMVSSADLSSLQASDTVGQNGASVHRLLNDLVATAPEYDAEAELLRRGGDHLPDILRGAVNAREVLLTGEAFEHVRRMYHESPVAKNYHALLGEVIDAALGQNVDATTLRILEIGAGTGAATAAVLPRLPDSAKYVFTDVTPFFLRQARAHLDDHPGLDFSVLDIEKDPTEQGYEAGAFDLVLADNVLHVTEDLRTSLGHVRKLLVPGGMLALLELTRRSPWLNLVFGLLDGWWRFTDLDLRPDYPLLDASRWTSLLEESGFEGATNLFDGAEEDHLQTLVLANAAEDAPISSEESPPKERQRNWLILADRDGTGQQVAQALQNHGHRCWIAVRGDHYRQQAERTFELPVGDATVFSRLLDEMRASDSAPDGIIHLWSLDGVSGDDVTAEAVMDAQRVGCESTLPLIQALEETNEPHPEIWLVTSGAQSVEREKVPRISQAPLWGLGRVLRNEQADVDCRLVDLSADCPSEEIDALVQELITDASEEEVALRGRKRFARRLHPMSLKEAPKLEARGSRSAEEDVFHLEIDTPGALDTLVLRENSPVEPGPGEVEIRVKASGLNFREVLQALDVMPPGLDGDISEERGVECAGVVRACGKGVEDFCPGDEVIALASPAHGSRVITPAYLTVPKPENISFAEAATVVNAFAAADYSLNDVAQLESGERVLIHSASGAVGHAAIQICQRMDAHVFATAGTPEKRAHLERLGIDHVMDSRSLDFYDEVLRDTGGEGVDVVINSLTGEAMQKSLDLLRPYGRFVELGKRDIYRNRQIDLRPFRNNLTYTAVDLLQIAENRPSLANSLLRRVVERVADGAWTPPPHTVFDISEAEEAFRLMARAEHIGKVVLTMEKPSYEVVPLEGQSLYCPEATYLIIGGLGGFGLAAAEWLVQRGAQHLVLVSRSGTAKEDSGTLDDLRASSAQVVVMRGDVADEGDVERVLGRIRREMPPLKGIVHAAMVLDDDMLVNLDENRFRAVLAPKVAGAWNLHRLTRQDELDFFVSFSSIASVVGQPMQGNYAAANAFLDTLAAHRRARELPALTVGWGAIAGVGYVSRHDEVGRHLNRSGLERFTPEEALNTLDRLLERDVAHVAAARIEWEKWAKKNPVAAASKRFRPVVAELERPDGQASEQLSESPKTSLQRAAPEERQELMETYLVQKIARVLGGTPEKIDPARPLTELGFDSLMAVELITAFKRDLGVKLPVVKILKGITGRELADVLLEKLFGDTEDADPAEEEETEADPSVERGHPLSFEQRRFWFLERLAPGNAAYNLPVAARLTGDLDVGALERSLSEGVRRHEMLRTNIREIDGEPRQVIGAEEPVSLPVIDLRQISVQDREDEFQRRARETIQKPFDLGEGLLLRASLFQMEADEHILLLVVHHIACDAWSMNMFVREITRLYDAFSEGHPSPLSEPSLQYLDYIRRQQELLTDERVDSQLAYWEKQLEGAPDRLHLPDLSAETSTSSGGHQQFELSRELTEALQALSADEGMTLFMTLLAAFQTLLHRYAGNDDISVGTAVSKREQLGDEAVLGCCMNTVVLRSDLSGDPTFRELLQRIRETTLEAFEHSDVPFERVVEAVRPERELNRTPLFQAMLVLHNARLPTLSMKGLDLTPVEVESGTAVADLVLLADVGEQLTGTLEYSTDLLDADAAEQMLEHFVTLLEGLVADLDRPISMVPLPSEAEQHRMLEEWNDTAADFDGPPCLHELFEVQVKQTPEATAVVSDDEQLTYRELDRRADSLAHHLIELGVEPDVVVGLYSKPSVERIIALLGILKAGGAFLPMDPRDPPQRLRFMIQDAEIPLLLTQRRLVDSLPDHGARIVLMDEAREPLGQDRTQQPTHRATAGDLAYVIYTSGSTGTPKGVMLTHSAICNQVHARQATFPLKTSDAVLQRTPVGFDPSIWEVFGPLSAGARVVVPPAESRQDAVEMLRLIGKEQVTVLQVVPSLLSVLLEEPTIESCSSLRHVFCGGEPLTPPLRDRFFERLPDTALHNMYGPTEAAIDVTSWTCRKTNGPSEVPIGRPIANVQVYVLDDHQQSVPAGIPGELYVGGSGLARGYVGDPELTAENFIPNPFSEEPDARLYRTGDLARWRRDGALEFLGRRDEQVKIRGHRVEPAEGAAVLMRHPAVHEAAVVTRESTSQDRQLVAYVVPEENHDPSRDALQSHAASHLPPYMVPSEVVFVESLPKLPSGKVDRGALVAKGHDDSGGDRPHVEPRNHVELQLVQLWEDLLDASPIGVTDDFFELGGHSLLAMRLIARIRQRFGDELSPVDLVQHSTVEQLAELLGRSDSAGQSPIVALQPNGTKSPFICVHPSSGSIMCYRDLVRALGTNRPCYGVQSPALDRAEEPPTRIEDMAAEYVRGLQEAQREGPYFLGGWSMGAMVAYEMACQLHAQDEKVAVLSLFDPPPAAVAERNGGEAYAKRLSGFAERVGLSPDVLAVPDGFWELGPEEQAKYVHDQIRNTRHLPDDLDTADLHRRLRLHAANMEALRSYRPQPFEGHVRLFESSDAAGETSVDGGDGWRDLATGGLTRYSVPGDHYSMLQDPNVQTLARKLISSWEEAPGNTVMK